MDLYERHSDRVPVAPVLVWALEGWVDAGFGAAMAAAALLAGVETEPLLTFDADTFIDHRARRPVVRITDGMNVGVTWPEIQLRVGTDAVGNDLLVLVGPEPDMGWRAFTGAVVDLARDLSVRLAVGFGAFPAPVPHTRAVRLASTASTPELAASVGYVPGTLDVPAPIGGVLEHALGASGIPSVGLWARVPHYVSASQYPAAAAALLAGLRDVAGVEVPTTELDAAARETRSRIDALIANSDDHGRMVAALEHQVDAEERSPFGPGDLPSGDEIAAELERFLRGETG